MIGVRGKALFAAAMLTVAGAAGPAGAAEEQVKIALPALTMFFAPTYIAEDAGFWKKHGLDVKLINITGIGAMNAVLSGSVEFSNSSGPSLIRANIRGQHLVAIGSTLDGLPFELVVRKQIAEAAKISLKSPIDVRAHALVGKKVAVDSPNTIVHGFLRYLMRKGGVDPERQITVASMRPEAALAALKSGAVDAAVLSTPYSLMSQLQGTGVIVASSLRGDFPEMLPFTFNIVPAKPETCEKRPTMCEKLMEGYADAIAFIREHPEEAFAIMKKRMAGVDVRALRGAFDDVRKWTPKTTKINVEGLKHAQDLMIEGKMIKPSEKLASFDAIYTNKYAK